MAQIDERAVKFHTIGNTLVAEQKYNEALANFEKALDLAPNYDACLYHMAEAFEAKQLDDRAYDCYVKAIELKPEYATSHIDAGLDTLLSGPLGKAVSDYKARIKAAAEGGAPQEGGPDGATQMQQQSHGEYDGPLAQKGLAPQKLVIEGDAEFTFSVQAVEEFTVRVLGDRDVPVLEAPVTFTVVLEDQRLADAGLGKTKEEVYQSPVHSLTVQSDENGMATAYFRSSKFTGANIVSASIAGTLEQRFIGSTMAGDIADIVIEPAESSFPTGSEITFKGTVKDGNGNAVAERDILFNLMEHDGSTWVVNDAATTKTDDEGVAQYTFRLPTRTGATCRLQLINKDADYINKIDFRVKSGGVTSALFIPMKGQVPGGREFALKVKLLDEFDNHVAGVPAAIEIKETTGGDWCLGEPSGAVTGDDGSIFLMVTPPAEVGASAVFTVNAEGLDDESGTIATFETVEATEEEPVDKTPAVESVPGFDLDLPADKSDSGLTSDFMASVLQPEEKPVETEVDGPGLEGLDYDGDDSFSGDTAVAQQALDGEPAETSDSQQGSALDALDSMLGQEGDIPPDAGADFEPEPEEPSFDTGGQGPGLVLPDDTDDPVMPAGEQAPEQTVSAGPTAEATGQHAPSSSIEVLDLVPEQESLSCIVGEDVHIAVQALDNEGETITSGVKLEFKIVSEPERTADACFLLPDENPGDKILAVKADGSQTIDAALHASTATGEIVVEVSCRGIRRKVTVEVTAGEPDSLELTAPVTQLPKDEMTVVTAYLKDKFDNPVSGRTLTFLIENTKGQGGYFEEPVTVTTDGRGEAQATYVSDGDPGDKTVLTAEVS